jgi:hypothetical protein
MSVGPVSRAALACACTFEYHVSEAARHRRARRVTDARVHELAAMRQAGYAYGHAFRAAELAYDLAWSQHRTRAGCR